MTDRSKAPVPSKNINFNLPEEYEFSLSNKLKVNFVKKENLPIIQFYLFLYSGSYFNPEGKSGLSKMVSYCLDEGAGGLSALEIDDKIESMGAVLSSNSNHDCSFLTLLTLKDNVHQAMDIYSKILIEPHFEEKDFIREKEKAITNIIQLNDRPEYLATDLIERILFKQTGYELPSIGKMEHVESFTVNDIKKFYNNFYAPENAQMVVVGNIEPDELKSMMENFLANWNSKFQQKIKAADFNPETAKVFFRLKEDAAQSEIRIGHLTGIKTEENVYRNLIFNTIFGGQFSSRINKNLREDKGYTYGAHSSFNYNRFGAYFDISTSVDSINTGNAVKEIFKEIDLIKGKILGSEIDFAKSYQIKKLPSAFETYSQIAVNIGSRIMHNLNKNNFNKYVENLSKIKKSDVEFVARETIKKENLVTVVVGNESSYNQLKEYFGMPPIVVND